MQLTAAFDWSSSHNNSHKHGEQSSPFTAKSCANIYYHTSEAWRAELSIYQKYGANNYLACLCCIISHMLAIIIHSLGCLRFKSAKGLWACWKHAKQWFCATPTKHKNSQNKVKTHNFTEITLSYLYHFVWGAEIRNTGPYHFVLNCKTPKARKEGPNARFAINIVIFMILVLSAYFRSKYTFSMQRMLIYVQNIVLSTLCSN